MNYLILYRNKENFILKILVRFNVKPIRWNHRFLDDMLCQLPIFRFFYIIKNLFLFKGRFY